jgi:hypothetical protein
MDGKKLKYVVEARLPFPSENLMLCVRAEGNDHDLRRIAISALLQMLEAKWKQLNQGIHRLSIGADKTSGRKRDARGRYIADMLSTPKAAKEVTSHREQIRLVKIYNTILARAAQADARIPMR